MAKKKLIPNIPNPLFPQSRQADYPKATTTRIPESVARARAAAHNANMTFQNQQGRASGVSVGGKTYLGLSPSEVAALKRQAIEKSGELETLGEASQALGTMAMEEREKSVIAPEDILKLQTAQEEMQPSEGDFSASALAFGKKGYLAGQKLPEGMQVQENIAPISTASITLIPLKAIGKISTATKLLGLGTLSSVFGGMRRAGVKEVYNDFDNAKSNLNTIISNVKLGQDPAEARAEWDAHIAIILESQRQLKQKTSGINGLTNFLTGGAEKLADVDNFLGPTNRLNLEMQFNNAVMLR
jgi:hypothetical protein